MEESQDNAYDDEFELSGEGSISDEDQSVSDVEDEEPNVSQERVCVNRRIVEALSCVPLGRLWQMFGEATNSHQKWIWA